MSGQGGVVLTLMALAQQLKQMSDLIRQLTPGIPPDGVPVTPIPVTIIVPQDGAPPYPNAQPVTITPELSTVIMELPTAFSITDTTPQEILNYEVPQGYVLYLNEISIAPDADCKTKGRFNIAVAGAFVKDIQLLTTLSLSWGWLLLFAGSKISIWVKSTDGTAVGGNVVMNGRRVRARTA